MSLTEDFVEESGPGAARQMEAEEVDGHAGQRHGDAHQRVDGVAVERHHHQEEAAQAVHDGEEQGQLWEGQPTGGRKLVFNIFCGFFFFSFLKCRHANGALTLMGRCNLGALMRR